MSKRTTFTTITPLPAGMSREAAVAFLHDHLEMIDLNPLVTKRHTIPPPEHAEPEEQSCVWYSITDRLYYIPGIATGDVAYTCAFHNLPWGLQTHCYAPMGLDLRDKWSIGGSLPGEPPQPQELGLGAPMTGLYLREDVDFRCNIVMASFVKRTLKKSHASLVQTMAAKMRLLGAVADSPEVAPTQDGDGGSAGWKQQQQQGTKDHALEHKPTFVSGGANQGQPGQGMSYQPYQVPGLHEAPGSELHEAPGSEPGLNAAAAS